MVAKNSGKPGRMTRFPSWVPVLLSLFLLRASKAFTDMPDVYQYPRASAALQCPRLHSQGVHRIGAEKVVAGLRQVGKVEDRL